MTPTRILIVDDSVVIRRALVSSLSAEPGLELLRPAATGRIAVARIKENRPDFVILDVEMPEMSGLETLAEIRKFDGALPIVMFSAHTDKGTATTLDALALGATDYVMKPSSLGPAGTSLEEVRDQLLNRIQTFCPREPAEVVNEKAVLPRAAAMRTTQTAKKQVDVVAIGVSTGGPNALCEVIPALPNDLPVPVLIVQHMPPMFTQMLAERLDQKSGLSVREGKDGVSPAPGEVWIAPGGKHMILQKKQSNVHLRLNEDPPENSCRPAVDVLFRSVVKNYDSVLAIILTGMGQDGLRGCEVVRDHGGHIVVQDEASSVVWGMPGFVAKAGLADEILPINQISDSITRRLEL